MKVIKCDKCGCVTKKGCLLRKRFEVRVLTVNKREIYDTNRTMRQKPHRTGGWCPVCDMAKVFAGQRCRACGHRIKPARFRKTA